MIRHGRPMTIAEIDELDALSRKRALTIEESDRLAAAVRKEKRAATEWKRRHKKPATAELKTPREGIAHHEGA